MIFMGLEKHICKYGVILLNNKGKLFLGQNSFSIDNLLPKFDKAKKKMIAIKKILDLNKYFLNTSVIVLSSYNSYVILK